nr:Chain A, Major prion protein [Homo sapiens]6PQ5_B Chain B, Major prion protein [Homo sapiens]
AGAAAA